ncbi:TonB-dependent receptor domain-containing protein [Mucilaginibacter sp.]|uniref:TonB-dependent receptor n=1 Tax=Mucilaginibacter sp. TaxID=1882438 RepID=UPI00284BCD8F|nr:TonB-dependent receptor [Mucilaginibacter sp.]MDR3693743.1 TonB-dependent receptor [Mucilaginibacter sp.]
MVAKFYLIAFFILFSAGALAQNTTTLKGHINDKNTNEPLTGAVILIDGNKNSAVVDQQGEYTLLNITPGKHQVVVKYIGYLNYSENINVNAGETLVLNIKMNQNTQNLNEVNVHGRLLTENEAASRANEKNSDNLKNVVSAEAIAKSPDINAANVLQRVSGVTIQRNAGGDDSYAIIRGLEPRYNNTLINGVQIASPDSKTRLVSLSVVPSELLARIEVDKTLKPEMDGDAIGGTVNLVFKDAPDKKEITATTSIGYDQLFIDRKFVDFSKNDINTYSPSEKYGAAYAAQPGDFTRSNLDFKNITAPPTETFSFSFGERLLNQKLGLVIGNSYQNLYFGSNTQGDDGGRDPGAADHRPIITDIYNRSISSHQILNNFIAHLDYSFNEKNKIIFDNVLLYSRLEEASFTADTSITGGNGGRTIPGTGPVNLINQSTTSNQIIENLKLAGNHVLSQHFQFDWYGAFSDAFVRLPDQAAINSNILISYDPSTTQFTKTPQYFDNIDRTWSHNNDRDYSGSANITYKTTIKNAALELKAGGFYRDKSRYNYEDEYILRPTPSASGGKPPFIDIYSAKWDVYTIYGIGDYNVNNYTATEQVGAYYGEFKLTLPRLEVFGGLRTETTSQDIHIRQDITNANEITKNYTDFLPSISFKYKLNEKANLRLAYFASIARPAYYELVPTTPPSTGGAAVEGNPGLLHTTANNFDIRYELFPKKDEQLFFGAFYKDLTNPIEYSYSGNSGANSIIHPINTPNAKVAGIELAFTKYFGDFGISGNYAYNYSDVRDTSKINRFVPAINGKTNYATEHRMLNGASVHDLNLSLLYRNKKAKLNVQVAFQYLGKTLVGRYDFNGDNYIQQPLSSLAFSADKAISKHFTLFTKLNNLLNTHTTIVLHNFNNGDEITKASYLAGMRYNY